MTLGAPSSSSSSSSHAQIHGSLLTFECVLKYCISRSYYIHQLDLERECRLVLAQRDSKRPMIKLAVIKLLPLLARYQTAKFIKLNLLDQALSFLIKVLDDTNSSRALHSKSRESLHLRLHRKHTLKSIGSLATIVGPNLIRSTKTELVQSKALKTLGRMLQATKSQNQLAQILKIMLHSFNLALAAKKNALKNKGELQRRLDSTQDLKPSSAHLKASTESLEGSRWFT